MQPKIITVALVFSSFLVQAGAAQDAQSSSTKQHGAVHSTAAGEKSVTGCVAREGDAFVLKTDDGTYEFDTARDLSPYVGKRVRITGKWKSTGITTTAPVKNVAGAEQTEQATEPPAGKNTPINSFSGDLHLHISGQVMGECSSSKE